jgi:16S rRNA (uracil1498-N3)-methyltransferase
MPAERYYYPHSLVQDDEIILEDQEFHHLVHVMRNRVEDRIEVVNGLGQLATARALLSIESVFTEQPPRHKLILAQAIPRQNRLDTILEKGTELGMTEVWLFPAAHSEKKDFSDNQQERIHTILVAAMKQCGRLFLPKFVEMPPIKKWQTFPLPAFFGDVNPDVPKLEDAFKHHFEVSEALICIGPESGFNSDEITLLRQFGAEGVSLHPNILRTDTAAIASLALLSHWILKQDRTG